MIPIPTLLIALMMVSAAALLALAARQEVHRRSLARQAHKLGLNFTPSDPFGLTRRLAGFELMQAGHSSTVSHVVFGRFRGWFLRGFDFRYEAGHGPARIARRFMVVAVDTPLRLPAVRLWRTEQARPSLAPAEPAARVGADWWGVGALEVAEAVARCWPGESAEPVCIEAAGGVMLVSVPGRLEGAILRKTADCLDRLTRADRSLQPD